MKKLLRYLLTLFFIVAGVNHFINPQFYLPLIPPYFPFPESINVVAGIVEILFGFGLLLEKTRKAAAWGIVLLLVAFIPSHVYFIQIGSCVPDGLCVPAWVGWVRLVIIHPILFAWAYFCTKN
ncbi:DoxX family protein [Mariniradius sediminis]|uniref:DoxX family protein n=1 Tax=Mariniradius sediminis TaxID=2909237 RepID=A0ABS9BU34_9BACT|nr:MauE/DoxX family redox-associated membrane protein [Mariniradius sediminis]MCF1751518.1 DoxX family protein [Mariniradius sediminis]